MRLIGIDDHPVARMYGKRIRVQVDGIRDIG